MNYNPTVYAESIAEVLFSAADTLLGTFAGYVPSLVGALFLFVLGLFVSSSLRRVARRIMKWTGFTGVTEGGEVGKMFGYIGFKRSMSDLVASVVYWIVLLLFLTATFEVLGLSIVVETLNQLIAYLPHVIVAAVTVVLAMLVGRFVKQVIVAALGRLQISYGQGVAALAEGLIILFGATIALGQLGLDVSVITTNVTIIITGIVAAAALAFGLGAKVAAGNLIAAYYVRQSMNVGDTVHLSGLHGQIKSINQLGVVLESDGKQALVPHEEVLRRGSL